MATLRTWFLETRPAFLLLVPACILVGIATAIYESTPLSFHVSHFLLAFLGALLAHISVNVLNDYFDYRSGVDLKTMRTPFSGGSGILPAGLLEPQKVFLFGILCLLGVVLIGVYFIYQLGWAILPLGLVGVILVYFYTTHLTKDPVLCAIAPGLGFGPLVVLGAHFTQAGEYTLSVAMASMVPGFLVSNLLLLNQFPDIEADKVASRRHIPILMGANASAKIYTAFMVATYAWIALTVSLQILPWTALLGMATLPLAIKAVRGVLKNATEREKLIPFMGINTMVTLLTPLLLGIGILIGLAL